MAGSASPTWRTPSSFSGSSSPSHRRKRSLSNSGSPGSATNASKISKTPHQTRPRRIQVNVIAHRAEICPVLSVHRDRFVTSLEQMAPRPVLHVVPDCVGGLQPLHPGRKVRLRGFKEHVVMVAHQNVGTHPPGGPLAGLPSVFKNSSRSPSSRKIVSKRSPRSFTW